MERAFLRSINIQLDVGHPERIEHFRPTSKSVRLISSLLEGDRGSAVFVVAPYGSGKSITAGYVGELVENRPHAAGMLRVVEGKLKDVDPVLGQTARQRRESGVRGLFVPLYGHVRSTPGALKEGIRAAMQRCRLGRQLRTIEGLPADSSHHVSGLISATAEKLDGGEFDRLVIVWDEFGRHLQGLISEGRPEELDVLQVLAEVVARTSPVPVSLVLLLHRSLSGYAGALPSGVRREWAKIEGRFETLQYLDDSRELYELIGSLVEESRPTAPEEVDFGWLAAQAREVGLFPDVEADRLGGILSAAFPLEPSTLFLLPRVAARVAQNERTLFSFLQWVSLEDEVPPGAIYDYFRGEFRNDGGPGGTQRPWLETESALQKIEAGSPEEEALKCAFLLGLGLSGERAHATYSQVRFALNPDDPENAGAVLDGLIDKKLLVHRRHSDQLVVWHGTDVDLRGRMEDEKRRGARDFYLASFLDRETPPPVWRPIEYNAKRGVHRYLESEYTTVGGLDAFLQEHQLQGGWEPGCDGRILYVLPENDAEFEAAEAKALKNEDPRLIVAVARDVAALREAALDLWCLLRMHADHELIGRDPLVKAELDHLTDDARTGLQPLVNRVLLPQPRGSLWFHRGRRLLVSSPAQLRRSLSQTMEDVFSCTPEIDSEMVVRRAPTPVVINARKKVELGILERYGSEDLAIEGHFADKAIFRCVFLRTGLYKRAGESWRLASPGELKLPGLASVWRRIRDFFTEPGNDKSFRIFINELLEPPFGVREGLIPLFLAAGVRAFPTAIAIRHKGVFVGDVLPSVIEDIARSPDDYRIDVVGLSEAQEQYLSGLLRLFLEDEGDPVQEAARPGDLLRACMDAVIAWRHTLPPAVSSSRRLSREAKAFERELASPDPVRLFLQELPRILGANPNEPEELLRAVARLRDELAGIEMAFVTEAEESLRQTLEARGITNGSGVRKQAARWAANFPRSFRARLPDRVARGMLSSMGGRYKDDGALMNALAALLVGRPFRQWDDSAVFTFRRQLRSAFDLIEGTALGMSDAPDLDPELRTGLVSLAKAKAAAVAEQLANLLGRDGASEVLEGIAEELRSHEVRKGM